MSKLSDYCINITDGEHASVSDSPDGEYYLLSNKNLINSTVFFDDTDRKIDRQTFDKINQRTKLEDGDVLISTVGTLGKTAVVKEPINFVFQRSVGIIKTDKRKLSPYFLKYKLDSPQYNKLLNKISKGAVQKCLFINDLMDLQIDIPEIQYQEKVAIILKSIDDKIFNNNTINAELENITKDIYDYWFLQFDFPNEEGKPYKSSGGKMVWNEELRREIPEDFRVIDILDICYIVDCLHSKKPDYIYENDKYYLLSLENISKEGYIDLSDKYYISEKDYREWTSRIVLKENDFVVTNAGRAGDIGKVQKNVECAIGRNITAIRPHKINPYYLRQFFKSNYITEQIQNNLDCGAFFKSFNVKSIKKLKVLVPSEKIYQDFNDIACGIVRRIESNLEENQELMSLRKFLLPLLMNGQVGFMEE